MRQEHPSKAEAQVGVRELRLNLSRYLQRVKRGETVKITEHGRPVAILQPLPETDAWLERMIAAGKATRAVGNLSDLGPPPPLPPGARPLSEVLEEMRNEERY